MKTRRSAVVSLGVLLLTALSWPENRRFQPTGAAPNGKAVAPSPQHVLPRLGVRPLTFELNQGQTDAQVRFLSRGSHHALFLTSTEAVLQLARTDARDPSFRAVDEFFVSQSADHARNRREAVLRMKLTGANPEPRVAGAEQLRAKVNYFIGNDPTQWRTNVPVYAKVKYEDVYPGVDLVYYGNQQQVEYDFVLAPGADPRMITLAFEGQQELEIDSAGDLLLHTGAGTIRQRRPVAYQDVDGVRRHVDSTNVLRAGNQVGFEIGGYDPAKPLVIDPVIGLAYSSFLGGSGDEDFPVGFSPGGNPIAVDAAGLVYVTGATHSLDFPVSAGAFDPSLNASTDAYVTVLNPDPADGDPLHPGDATDLLYSTYLGGSTNPWSNGQGPDWGNSIAVDTRGNVYVVGTTGSRDFPTTPGALDVSLGGNSDAFLTVLAPTSAAVGLLYSTYLGGGELEAGIGIAVEFSTGIVAVTGYTRSGSSTGDPFPTTSGAFDNSLNGLQDAFVTLLTPDDTDGDRSNLGDATDLLYSTHLGGSNFESGIGIALDPAGRSLLYITGWTASVDFPTTSGAFDDTANGLSDGFIAVLTPDNNGIAPDPTDLRYSTYLGGNAIDVGAGIAVDTGGRAYVTGRTESFTFPTTSGAFDLSLNASADAFVTALMPDNSGVAPDAGDLLYSTYLGGGPTNNVIGPGLSGAERGNAIAVFELGTATSVYVTGFTRSAGFPTPGGFDTSLGGFSDAFVAKLVPDNTDGQPNSPGDVTDLVWATYLGGSGEDEGQGIAVDGSGRAYVKGSTRSVSFPTTAGAFDNFFGGGLRDAFVAVIQ